MFYYTKWKVTSAHKRGMSVVTFFINTRESYGNISQNPVVRTLAQTATTYRFGPDMVVQSVDFVDRFYGQDALEDEGIVPDRVDEVPEDLRL